MARGKKKESALTPEEKLAQALVPEDEQPYKVPENWNWIYLKAGCSDFIVPQRDKPKVFDGDIPWCRIEDIEAKLVDLCFQTTGMGCAVVYIPRCYENICNNTRFGITGLVI